MHYSILRSQFFYFLQLWLFLINWKVNVSHLIKHLNIWLQFGIFFLKECQFCAEFLKELLNYPREVRNTNLPISSTFWMIIFKQVLQVSIDAQILFDVYQLLSISFGNLPWLLQLILVVFLQPKNQVLILNTVTALIMLLLTIVGPRARHTSHLRRSILSNLWLTI